MKTQHKVNLYDVRYTSLSGIPRNKFYKCHILYKLL